MGSTQENCALAKKKGFAVRCNSYNKQRSDEVVLYSFTIGGFVLFSNEFRAWRGVHVKYIKKPQWPALNSNIEFKLTMQHCLKHCSSSPKGIKDNITNSQWISGKNYAMMHTKNRRSHLKNNHVR